MSELLFFKDSAAFVIALINKSFTLNSIFCNILFWNILHYSTVETFFDLFYNDAKKTTQALIGSAWVKVVAEPIKVNVSNTRKL